MDCSGRGHHGVLKSCKWKKTPDIAQLEFDGSGYVTVPYHKDFDISGDMTLAFWMCPLQVPERHVLLAGRGDPCRPYLFWWRENEFTFIQSNRHGQTMMYLGRPHYPVGKWIHVSAVVCGQEGRFYVDGAEIRRFKRSGVPSGSTAPFTIGGFENTWHPYF